MVIINNGKNVSAAQGVKKVLTAYSELWFD